MLARLGVTTPYLLFVGTAEPRKNLGRLLAAWREVRRSRPEVNLVLVGRSGEDPIYSKVLNSSGEPALVIAGRLADEDVAGLMSGAAVFVYPSLYEGFGLPVLEAMQAGAPVLISRDASLLEVTSDAAVAVDAESTAELARAIVELVGDPRRRAELQIGRAHV